MASSHETYKVLQWLDNKPPVSEWTWDRVFSMKKIGEKRQEVPDTQASMLDHEYVDTDQHEKITVEERELILKQID